MNAKRKSKRPIPEVPELDPRAAENGPPMRCAERQMQSKHRTDSATTNKCGYNDHSHQKCENPKEMSMNVNIERKCQYQTRKEMLIKMIRTRYGSTSSFTRLTPEHCHKNVSTYAHHEHEQLRSTSTTFPNATSYLDRS